MGKKEKNSKKNRGKSPEKRKRATNTPAPNFWLRMRAPEGKPSGSRHFRSPYRSCTLVVVQNVSVAHAHAITSGSTSAQHLRK